MTEYNEGDLVEAVKGETVIRGRLQTLGDYLWVGDSGRTSNTIEGYGFTITVIEKAAPVFVLPTEPGWYRDNANIIWRLSRAKNWHSSEKGSSPFALWEALLLIKLPIVHLEPVPETAKKVLERVRKVWPLLNTVDLDLIAAELGVTL